jgi:hypothetical protein
VGNEPETLGQGAYTPAEYANIYHEVYRFIRERDPTARVANGGLVMPSPLRLRWLDLCLAEYEARYGEPMPVDVWNTHVQILQERAGAWGCGIPVGLAEESGRRYEIIDNCEPRVFAQLVREFRVWMYERGQAHRPLIISEYGVLMPSSYLPRGDQDVLRFMAESLHWMLTVTDPDIGCADDGGRLVQRWAWFSLNVPSFDVAAEGFNGALLSGEAEPQLTAFGSLYRDATRQALGRDVELGASPSYSDCMGAAIP